MKTSIKNFLCQGKQLKQEGKLEEAISATSQVFLLDRNNVPAHFQLAAIYEKVENFDKAIIHYKHILQQKPNNSSAFAKLARVMMKQGNSREAIANYRKAIECNPQQPIWTYISMGEAFTQNEQIEDAIAAYKKALELDFHSIPAFSKLAAIYSKQKEYDRAFSCYFKIISLQPKKLFFWQNLVRVSREYSQILLKQNNLNKAIATYQKFLSHKIPKNDQISEKIDLIYDIWGMTITTLCVRQGEFSRAIIFFQKAIDKYPHNEWNYYHLGNILTKQDKIVRAIILFKQAVQIRPKFPLALLLLGELLLKIECRDRAFQCGLKILENHGNFHDGDLNKRLIQLLVVHSNPKQSQAALKKAVEQLENSSHKPYLKANTYENIGTILRNQGWLSEAIRVYQKATYYQLQNLKPKFADFCGEIGKFQEPNFLILGFAKCGTTAFYDYLCQHPQVLPAINKEPMYLYNWLTKLQDFETRNWSLPSLEKELYLAHFAPRPEGSYFITGEASTNNILSGCEKIISDWFPTIKLIVILREPVRRTISHYEQFLKMGLQNQSLEQVINLELEELKATNNLVETITEKLKKDWWKQQIASSLYVYHLERWMNLFPREQFLILQNEDLAQYPAKTMKQAFDFLELSEFNSIKYESKNVGSYPQIDEKLLLRLSNFFQPHNERLEEFLGQRFNWGFV